MANWTPAEINPTFWIDFSDGATLTLAGSTITAVTNKGSQSLTITNTGTPTLLTAEQNGLDVAQLSSTGRFDLSASATPAGDRTVAVVWRKPSGGYAPVLTSSVAANSIFESGTNNQWQASSNSANPISHYNDPSLYYAQIYTTDRATADRYTDGRVHSRNQPVNTSDIFDRIANTSSAAFLLAEVIIVDSILATEDLLKLQGHLAVKWGLQSKLPDYHPYKAATPQVDDVITPSQAAWTPDKQGSLLWLDFSDPTTITLSGSDIVEIRDKTGHGNRAEGASAAVRPSILSAYQNGLNVAEFASVDRMFLFDGGSTRWQATPPGPRIVIIVGERSSSGYMFMLDTGGSSRQTRHYTGQWYVGTVGQAVALSAGQMYTLAHVTDRSTATRYLDGVAQAPTATTINDSAQSFGEAITLFGVSYGSTPNGMKIAEVIVLPHDATDTSVLQKAEGYVAQKWGLTLDPGHPYASTAPTITVYGAAPPIIVTPVEQAITGQTCTATQGEVDSGSDDGIWTIQHIIR